VTASTQEALDAAVGKINELMEQSFTPAPPATTPRPPGSHPGVCIMKTGCYPISYSIIN